MKILEIVYLLNQKHPNFLKFIKMLKKVGLLKEILEIEVKKSTSQNKNNNRITKGKDSNLDKYLKASM